MGYASLTWCEPRSLGSTPHSLWSICLSPPTSCLPFPYHSPHSLHTFALPTLCVHPTRSYRSLGMSGLSDCRLAWLNRTGGTKQAEDGEDSPPVRPSTAPPRPRRRPLPSPSGSAVWLLGDSGHREWHKVGRKDDALPNDHQQNRPSTSWISQRHRDEARRDAGRGGRGGRGTVRRGGGKAAPQQVRLRGRCTSLGPKLRPMSSPVQRTL